MVETSPDPYLSRRCPICRRELAHRTLEGLCLACLLKVGIEEKEEVSAESSGQTQDRPESGRFFGDYQLVREVGRGGMGIVYEARQFGTQRSVALKLLSAGALATREAIHRFHTEAQAAALLEHSNIVPIYEVGMHDGQYFLAMRFLGGGTLAEMAARESHSPPRLAAMMQKIAAAIHFAHTHGVLHRDLKPSNILLSETGAPFVSDFGLARIMAVDDRMTLSTALLGTAAYMSPEQIKEGAASSTIASDVYGLGAVFYELLAGQPPFRGATLGETLRLIQEQEPLPPSQVARGQGSIPPDLETVCLKCLEKEPSRRYATAQELADELDRFLKDESVHARPVSGTEKVWRWCRRKPAIATLGILVLVLVLVVVLSAPIAILRINRARLDAERSRVEANRARVDAERNLYAADMKLASEALRNGAIGQVQELLSRHHPAKGAEDLRGFEWRYLQNAANQTGLVTHELQGLSASKMLYDPRLVIAGTTLFNYQEDPRQILAWDLRTWSLLSLALPPEPNSEWWWYPEQQAALAVNSKDRTIAVYRLPRFEKGPVVPLPGKAIQAAVSMPFRSLAVVFQDGDLRRVLVWDLVANSQRAIFGESRRELSKIEFSPDGNVLMVDWDDREIELWSITEDKALLSPLREPLADSDASPFFAPHSTHLFVNRGFSKDLKVWDWSSGKLSPVYQADLGGIQAFGFSPDGGTLATAWHGEAISLFDTKESRVIGTLRGHNALIISLVFSPSGRLIATASRDHTAKLWDLKTQRELATLGGNEQKVSAVAFTPDEKSVLTLSGDGKIKVWDLPALLERGVLLRTTNIFGNFALSADERELATSDGAVHVWDRVKGGEIFSIHTDELSPCHLAFSATGSFLAWAGRHSLGILDYQSGRTNILPIAGPDRFQWALFSPDCRELAFGGETGIMLCDVATLHARPFARCDKQVHAVAFSPNGSLLLSGHDGGGLSLWNRASASKITEIPGKVAHAPGVLDVEFSPDGQFVASAGADATGKIWEVTASGLKLFRTLRGHVGYMFSLQFSPDGRRALSCGSDHTLKLWDTETGLEVGTLYGHRGLVTRATFSPDGNTIYSTGQDCELRIWQAPPLARLPPFGRKTASETPEPRLNSENN